MQLRTILLVVLVLATTLSRAEDKGTTAPESWGFEISGRFANTPYVTNDESISDAPPFLYYYDNGLFFWDGLNIGVHAYDWEKWQFNVLGRFRYFDVPSEYTNITKQNAFDLGLQLQYNFTPQFHLDTEVFNDQEDRYHANLTANYDWKAGNWQLLPYATLRYKDASFNNYYYGLGIDEPGAAFDLALGAKARYNFYGNLYLTGSVQARILDDATYNASVINSRTETEYYVGIGYFSDLESKSSSKSKLRSKPYVRLAYGLATPSSLGEILTFDAANDEYGNSMTSLFYGHPMVDKLFGIDMPLYLTPGVVWHHESEVQGDSWEVVLAFKGYYTFKFPFKLRPGFGMGISYVDEITYIEQHEMDINNYTPTQLMKYLDVSLDINLYDIIKTPSLKDWWFGYSIHHRSAIYEISSAFGNIKGGSNYQTLYLQYHW